MSSALVWFRQDLRLADNPAFFEACINHDTVIPIYILDENSVLGDAQAWWLHHSLNALNHSLTTKLNLTLILRKRAALEILLDLVKVTEIDAIYWNRCYEPKSIERDKKIKATLPGSGIDVFSFNGSLFNEPWTISTKSGDFFKVFTPYWKTCRQVLSPPSEQLITHHPGSLALKSDAINDWGLVPSLDWASQFPQFWTPGEEGARRRLQEFIQDHLHGYKINRLTKKYGKGFSVSTLRDIRQFYLVYPDITIHHAVRGKSSNELSLSPNLGWIHYRSLMRIDRPEARQFYTVEAEKNAWSGRELERQINRSPS
ncbi:deoxyribodipyrimidine photo-lyase [Legionella lytica]|uniref:Deoxyribodipyrimidine photo-lyase n=1 Tax=Legionella lytica TaxID=96232 RepID=A0ABY4YB17_9GAMM|nr:deoxyribodipyrimidine photo-lyase [Legionella lytica]USQ14853.1 deoxyribodipyrimidine photo-lyase [Legionella lytica]